MATILVSGGFDPLTTGHIALIEGAARYGLVLVALNSDEWLVRKKGYRLMPWADRRAILLALRNVYFVSAVEDADGTVAEAIRRLRPSFFANGGDRTAADAIEHEACAAAGARELFGVGGGKIASSGALIEAAFEQHKARGKAG